MKVFNIVLSDKKNPILLGNFQGEIEPEELFRISIPLDEEKENIINNNNDIQFNITFTLEGTYISGICKIQKISDSGNNTFLFTGMMSFQLNESELTVPMMASKVSGNLIITMLL